MGILSCLLLFFQTFALTSHFVGFFLGLGFSCVVIALFLAIYTMVFDYPEIINLAYPYQQLTRIASLGEMIAHVEAVFLGIWIITASIHFAIILYLTAYLFAGALQINKFEPLILPFAGLALLIGLLTENVFQITKFKKYY